MRGWSFTPETSVSPHHRNPKTWKIGASPPMIFVMALVKKSHIAVYVGCLFCKGEDPYCAPQSLIVLPFERFITTSAGIVVLGPSPIEPSATLGIGDRKYDISDVLRKLAEDAVWSL